MLKIENVTIRVAGRPLLESASATANPGEKVGLVGRNGSGKSTLLRLIAGQGHVQGATPDAGTISVPRKQRLGMIAQDAPSGPESLLDTVLAADQERSSLLAEAETATDGFRIAEIHERLVEIRADSAPARAARILAGLGFDDTAQGRPCAEFSGGWRMRVALAALLFSAPDILLLDEPTNHLDLEATIWLEGFLKSYPGTLVLVSHDRDLLNAVPEAIIHLEGLTLTRYAGNYDRFERTRREQQIRQLALRERQEVQRKHIQAFVDRFRYKASKARQAQSRLKALARMEPVASMVDETTMPIRLPEPKQLAPPILNLDRASVGYEPGKPILRRLDLRIDMDDRIALLGANGNGKSTLVKLLGGRLSPETGEMTRARGLKVGYFAQHQAEELDLEATPLQILARLEPRTPEEKLRGQLGRFGFGHEKVEVKVGSLSGGEKARLLLSLMSREAPNLLLLDEPTNHLDIDSRESLIQALNDFAGAVVLVSHDPHLIELVADRLWLVADGQVKSFDGDMDDYRKYLLTDRRAAETAQRKAAAAAATDEAGAGAEAGPGPATAPAPAGPKGKEKRRAAADARAALAHLRKTAKDAEKALERLTREKAELEQRMGDSGLYNGSAQDLSKLQRRHHEVGRAIGQAEARWLEAQSALEEASAA